MTKQNTPRTTRRIAAALTTAALAMTACGSDNDDTGNSPDIEAEPRKEDTIVDAVAAAGSFDTLIAAIEATDFEETLLEPGKSSITLFAPTDDAFAALPDGVLDALLLPENKDTLASILRYHVVSGGLELAISWGGNSGELQTLLGENTTYTNDQGALTIGGANVDEITLKADNGEIRAIDAILVPPSFDLAARLD